MKESFKLALRSLVRGHVLSLLLAAMALAHFLLPSLVRSDGTDAGWREMLVRAVVGSTYSFTAIAILGCACGFFAQERERFRLSLTVVRPVSAFAVAMGKWLALCTVAASAIMLSAVITVIRIPDAPHCMHHFVPSLPPPAVSAAKMMGEYLSDPQTPEHIKKAPRRAVLRLLANKELDRYDVVRPGTSFSWPFEVSQSFQSDFIVRVRFATQFDLRSPLAGEFAFDGCSGIVSNNTQSIVDVPLLGARVSCDSTGKSELKFKNTGGEVVMVRARRDLELLVPADSFAMNVFRAAAQMLSVTALLAAFGLFLSSALSRPVALFTAFVAVAVTLMSPSVILQFPDELDTTMANRIGLFISRAIQCLTQSAGDVSPVSCVATDSCIEWGEVLQSILFNMGIFSPTLLFLSAFVIRRKPLNL